MPRGRSHRKLRSLLAATALIGSSPLILAAAQPAWAQAASSAAAWSFDIPRQPLATALRQFADQSGMQLAYASADLQGLTSPGVRGSMPAAEALARLLAGTGATWRLTAANTVSIQRPAPAPAADAAAGGGLVLDPIVVQGGGFFGPTDGYVAEESRTATKTGTPLIETPQSVSVVTRRQMDDQKVQSVSQALRYSAGVAPETRPGRYDYPNIRGFGSPGGADANFVGLMDGLRLPRGVYYIAPSVDPYMLERVEILRGPSSILYGSVNPGGVVNLWSKRPTAEPLHEIDLEYGSYDRLQAGLDFGGPLTEDGSLLYRLTQTNVKTADPDPTHPYASIQTGEIRSRGVELEAHARVTDNLSLLGSLTVLDIVNTESTDYEDKRPFGVPDRLASLWADYSFTEGPLDGLALGAGVRYIGSSYGNAENTLKVPDVTLFDLGLRYDLGMLRPELEGTQVSINVANLFDREYVASCWADHSCFYGTRRTITAGLKLRW